MYLYPFNPTISEHGTIDLSSIHSKKHEVALTLFTTAIASLILYRTAPLKVTLLGTAAFGVISHLFWTKLGHWVPNKLADEKCIRAFSTKSAINQGLAKRVLNNDSLHNAIFNKLSSEPIGYDRDYLLNHYFQSLWPHIPLQERRAIYLKTIEKINSKRLFYFQPKAEAQFHMWTSLPIDLETASLLALNFDVDVTDESGKTVKEHFERDLYIAKPNCDWEANAARSLYSYLFLTRSPIDIYERNSDTGQVILQSNNKTVRDLLLPYVKSETV